ncbi:MAG: glycosyltransferase [Weeksellaceae bacterium]|nr:glycosyltransferase [Weeksellaceae bacterium]
MMQDYPGEIEFIIADDRSPDDTEEVVRKYISTNEIPGNFTIKYTRHEVNKGVPLNFSWAIEQASGKYIALCEGDDYWTDPLKLQKQVGFLEENEEYSLCFTAKINVNHEGVLIGEARYGHQKEWTAEDVLDGGFIAGIQTIVSKNLSIEFNEFCCKFPHRTGVDRLYSYFYGLQGKLKYIDETSAVYRIHDGGIWSVLNKQDKLTAHITQHLIFLEVIKKNTVHFQQLKRNMFRLILKDLYFSFYKEPVKTFKSLFFLCRKYRLSPTVFLLAGKDYATYYFKILASKF